MGRLAQQRHFGKISIKFPRINRSYSDAAGWRDDSTTNDDHCLEGCNEIDTGIVDADHKAIIAGINEIRGLLDQEITSAKLIETIRELRALAVAHFGREEQLQELPFFANQETHHLEHVQLIAELDQVIDGLSTIADTPPQRSSFSTKGLFPSLDPRFSP
ncbi:MAG: hemerythrin family protein [Rhodopseudomonas palustris]|nr:hemerythrin family protein [Rhodopseudomonas palustris]